jgi:hypothetical protein
MMLILSTTYRLHRRNSVLSAVKIAQMIVAYFGSIAVLIVIAIAAPTLTPEDLFEWAFG